MTNNGTLDGYDDIAGLLDDDIPIDPDEAAGRTSELGKAPVPGAPGQEGSSPAVATAPDQPDDGATHADGNGPVPDAGPATMAAQTAPAVPGPASPLERYVSALREEIEPDDDGQEVYVDPGTLLALAQACLDEARAEREQRLAADESLRRDVAAGLGSVSPIVTVNPTINISSVDAGDAVLHAESLTLPPAAAAALAATHAEPAAAAKQGDDGQRPDDAERQPARRRKGIPATVVGIALGLALGLVLLAVLLLVLQAVPGGAIGAL